MPLGWRQRCAYPRTSASLLADHEEWVTHLTAGRFQHHRLSDAPSEDGLAAGLPWRGGGRRRSSLPHPPSDAHIGRGRYLLARIVRLAYGSPNVGSGCRGSGRQRGLDAGLVASSWRGSIRTRSRAWGWNRRRSATSSPSYALGKGAWVTVTVTGAPLKIWSASPAAQKHRGGRDSGQRKPCNGRFCHSLACRPRVNGAARSVNVHQRASGRYQPGRPHLLDCRSRALRLRVDDHDDPTGL